MISLIPLASRSTRCFSGFLRSNVAGILHLGWKLGDTSNRLQSTVHLSNLNKHAKLQGILWGLEVLTGTNDAETFKEKAKRKRKEKKAEEKVHRVYDQSKEIDGLATNQTKYMKKIRKKLGSVDSSARGANVDSIKSVLERKAAIGKNAGDSEIYSVGHQMVKQVTKDQEDKQLKKGAAANWLLAPGMGGLLDYCFLRTVKIGLFPSFNTEDRLMDDFISQVEVPWHHIEPSLMDGVKKQKTTREKYCTTRLSSLLKKNSSFKELDPSVIMVVSSDDSLLKAAHDLGFYTLKFRVDQGLRGQVSTNFFAQSALEVQDAIEELNGIALRGSAFGSRSY